MVQVFISYARMDANFAGQLVRLLQQKGIKIWLAEEEIAPGEVFIEEIDSAINSADAIIVVISRNTGKSEFQQFELATALGNRKKIIPIVIDREASIPFFLRNIHYLYISNQSELVEKINLIEQSILGANELPNVDSIAESNVMQNKQAAKQQWINSYNLLFDAVERDRSLFIRSSLLVLIPIVSSLLLLFYLVDSILLKGVIIGFAIGIALGLIIFSIMFISRRYTSSEEKHPEVQGE